MCWLGLLPISSIKRVSSSKLTTQLAPLMQQPWRRELANGACTLVGGNGATTLLPHSMHRCLHAKTHASSHILPRSQTEARPSGATQWSCSTELKVGSSAELPQSHPPPGKGRTVRCTS